MRETRLYARATRVLGDDPARVWALGLGALIGLIGGGIGLSTGLAGLHGNWTGSYTYSHGYLVLAMGAWLLVGALQPGWHRRGASSPVAWRAGGLAQRARGMPSAAALVLLVVATAAYTLAEILDVNLVMQAMVPVLLWALIASLAGLGIAVRTAIPLGFLYFAVPIWNLLSVPLQNLTTLVVTSALPVSGITAYIEGHLVRTPSGMFEIAAGCSGLNFFVVALALATFYGLNWYRRWSTRVVLLAAAGLLSLISNWVRVYALIVIGDLSQMQHALITDGHYAFGWVVFAVVMAPALWLAWWLEIRERSAARAAPEADAQPARRHLAAAATANPAHPLPSASASLLAGVVAGLVLASPALLGAGPAPPAVPEVLASVEPYAPDWQPADPHAGWQPDYRRPHATLREAFEAPAGPQVDVYLARYLSQQRGAKLTDYRNQLDRDWQRVNSSIRELSSEAGRRTVREIELSAAGERRLVWYWYRVGGRTAHAAPRARLMEVAALVRGRRDGAVVAVSAPCSTQCEAAREQMGEFVQLTGTALERLADGEVAE